MHIEAVIIKGFRSLGSVTAQLQNYSCLIGKNDCGKSAFLRALQFLLDPDFLPSDEDKCRIDGYNTEVSVEAVLKECGDRQPYSIEGSIRLRRTLNGKTSKCEYWGQVPSNETLKKMKLGALNRPDIAADTTLSSEAKKVIDSALYELTPKGIVPKSTWQAVYQRLDKACLIQTINGWTEYDEEHLHGLVQVVMLEADARGEDEIQDTSKSVFNRVGGLLLREATRRHKGISDAKEALEAQIQNISTKTETGEWPINELNRFEIVLNEEVQRFSDSVRAESTLVPPKMPAFEFNVKVEISDNWVKGLSKMGHGLRRSVVYAMLRTHRRLRENTPLVGEESQDISTSPLYLFLIEEPELYLHPQAERQRKRELQELSQLPNTQVVLCTHSAMFVDINEYKGILRFSRPNRDVTDIDSWQGADFPPDEKKTLSTIRFLDPHRAAMLFADLVILVEGASEFVAIPCIAERLEIDTRGVEVVSCDSKNSIPMCQRILEGFGIKYIAWLDTDVANPILDMNFAVVSSSHLQIPPSEAKKTLDKIKSQITARCGRIILTPGNWETFNGIVGEKREKVYNSWKRFVYDENPPSPRLEARIRAAYDWQDYENDPVPIESVEQAKPSLVS